MGFRSTFCTQDYRIKWPQWFIDKYACTVQFQEDNQGALHSKFEAKTYSIWQALHKDIQAAITWSDFTDSFVLVYLHECGGITRCQIEEDRIVWSEPSVWSLVDDVTHDSCHGCSDS